MTILAVLFILPTLLTGCWMYFSTLQPEGSKERILYNMSEKQAFQIAHGFLATTLSPATSGHSKDDALKNPERIKGLHDRGIRTKEEFEAKKKELLNRL